MVTTKRAARGLIVLAATALVVAACGDDGDDGAAAPTSGGGAATTAPGATGGSDATGNEASDTGITEDTYKIGFVYSATGVAAPNFKDTLRAAEARVKLQNDQGGVFGRTIELVGADDASTPQQNLSASQSLVQNQDVFMVINNSSFTFGGYRYLQEEGIPVVGGCYDGPEWFQQPNTNMVCNVGNSSENRAAYTNDALFMKSQGATKVASLGYGSSPSSSKEAQNFHDFGAPEVGLDPVYVNTSLPFGTVDVGSIVLDMKAAGVEGVQLPLIQTTNFAVVTGGVQAGIDWKAALMSTGYGQDLLDQPTALAAAEQPGVFFSTTSFAPVELETEATKRMAEAFSTYSGLDGVPLYAWYQGWLSADLVIKGLEAAGRNPTRESFLDALHGLGTYDADGILAEPVDISLEGFGQAQERRCSWYMKVEDGRFVVASPGTEPLCGDLVPASIEG